MQIIPRSEWGAIYPRGFGSAPLPASEVWLHHSVTVAPDLVLPYTDDYTAVRTLERIGQQRFGGGISYTFAVTPVGLVFEGHGVDREGAHTLGRNSIARAIVLVGDYSTKAPTTAMKKSVAELLVYGWQQKWWKFAKLNGGHRDAPGAQTACPGDAAYKVIGEINALAAQLASTTTPTPTSDKGRTFMYLTQAEEKELLQKVRDIHWKEKTGLDWTKHGNPNVDDQLGHSLGVRLQIQALTVLIQEIKAALPK
jgi:hypothetical protein